MSPRLRTSVLVAVVVVLAAGAGVGGYAATRAARHVKPTPAPSAPRVLGAASATPSPARGGPAAPVPSGLQLAAALQPLLDQSALGTLRADVVDVSTGRVLISRSPAAAAAPASTAKLLTGVAVLATRRASYRIQTRVVSGKGGAIVLVGAGDPTLSGAAAGKHTAYPGAARISELAAQLRRAHITPTRIVVDDSLFTGPVVNPAWAPEDVPSGYASAIPALLADGGRAQPTDDFRSATPDLAAAQELGALLGRPQLSVVRGHAPAAARVLATVSSAPIGTLVEQMLQASDNVIAECLARQVAIATHLPASFVGAAHAVRNVLRRSGVDPGAGMVDGSGLAARDRLSAGTLAKTLRLAAVRPGLRTLLAGLPVAAWSGTLVSRYLRGSARAGAGVVRAKTGTLTGVATLAGTVHDRGGRLLAFALMSQGTASTVDAEAALDKVAAKLATL